MRTLVIVKPSLPAPPEMMVPLTQAFRDWRGQHRHDIKEFSFFANGQGGCGIVESADEMGLMQTMMTFPFAPFSTIETLPLVDGDEALEVFSAFAQQMAAQMSGQGPSG